QIVSRLRDEFNIEVPLQRFLNEPTVANVAMTITQMRGEIEGSEVIEQLLEKIEQMSPEQVEAIMEASGGGHRCAPASVSSAQPEAIKPPRSPASESSEKYACDNLEIIPMGD